MGKSLPTPSRPGRNRCYYRGVHLMLSVRREVAVTSGALFLAVFLACAVEAVEALTIVLAAGTAREWKSTWYGVGSALVVLAAVVLVLGPTVSLIPLTGLRLVVGGLLLV